MTAFLVSVYAIAWCLLHSLLLTEFVSRRIKRWLGEREYWYRLGYNLVSLSTLLPLLVLLNLSDSVLFFSWAGWLIVPRICLLGSGLACLYLGSRCYHFGSFLGTTQIKTRTESFLLVSEQEFSRAGILGLIRHPWYGGGVLLLWSIRPHYDELVFSVYSIFTIYLIGGAFWEEKKLRARYGDTYREYCQEVSMFFPMKWLKRKLSNSVKTHGPF